MEQRDRFTKILGDKLLPIVDIAHDEFDHTLPLNFTSQMTFSERDLRVIRFALNRAIESV